MSILVFDALVRLHPAWGYALLAAAAVAAWWAAKAAAPRFSLDVLIAPAGGKAWGALLYAVSAAFVWSVLRPVLPARVYAVVYWPVDAGWPMTAGHVVFLSALGGALWALGRLAGAFDGWRPAAVAPREVLATAAAGVSVGLACGVVGAAAARALFVAEALSRLGFSGPGWALLWGAAPAAALCAAFYTWLPAGSGDWERAWRAAAYGALLAAWVLPVGAAELTLRAAWDFGRPGLADAAGLPHADAAEEKALLILAEADGAPGFQRRTEKLVAEGLAVSRQGLSSVRRYLEGQRYRTVFLREALGYMRKGWALLWEPEMHMDACLVRLGPRFPPDYEGFLKAVQAAPATPENFERLENLARAADAAPFGSVKRAGQAYQALSDAYARFGDLESSNLWLRRIKGLWPLYEEDVNVDPIEDRHDGVVSGSVLLRDRPATAVQVGLFMQTSTASAPSAREGLVASTWPDENGRFAFRDLTPGRYYLALRSDPILLGDPRVEVLFSPGVFRLSASRMDWELMPIRLDRAPSFPPDASSALPPAGAVPLPLVR